MLNQVVIVGRVYEIKDGGIELVVPRSYKNSEGEYDNDYVDVRLYNALNDNVKEYCMKGDIVGVKGKLERLEHSGALSVVADKVTFLASKKNNESGE